MIFKVAGSAIVIISAALIGVLYSRTFAIRVDEIRDMQYSIQMLETEIMYGATPLMEAFKLISEKSKGSISKLFLAMSETLENKKYDSVYKAFEESYKSQKDNLYLQKDEMSIISSFMQSLGNSDAEGQKKNFNLTMQKLAGIEKSAEEIKAKDQKLFSYLGVCGGILIVIILI